jgi:diadenosine tetraphosphate (Ap4A) HIT family hydrolase
MDIGGLNFLGTEQPIPGRVLVIPKGHVVSFYELNDDEAAECFIIAKNISAKIKKAFNPEFVSFIIRGGRIPHVHIIIRAEFKENDPFGMMFRLMEAAFVPKFPDELLDDWFRRLKEA